MDNHTNQTSQAAEGRRQRGSPPAYLQIADTISEAISRGRYRPGDQLPTEGELRAEYGVSPMTVRRAIGILLDRGLVSTTRGKGTFVRSFDLGEAVFRLQDVTDQWTADSSVEVRLLEASIVPASSSVASALGSSPKTPTVFLRRLIMRGSTPLLYNLEYVIYDPGRPLVESQLQITSLEGLLKGGHGESRPSGQLTIEAVALDAEAARALQVPEGSPALSLELLLRDAEQRPVSWGWFLCRADQFRLTTQIGAGLRTGRKE